MSVEIFSYHHQLNSSLASCCIFENLTYCALPAHLANECTIQMPRFFAHICLLLEYNANSNYDIFCFTQYNKFDSSEF